MYKRPLHCVTLVCVVFLALWPATVHAEGNLHRVNHIVIVMQENHSFDNYFGALAYDPHSPYHNGNGGCRNNDHTCVDGLTCTSGPGGLACSNFNLEEDGTPVFAFHDPRLCVVPDLDHEWGGSHYEANFADPNDSLHHALNDGFVLQNDRSINGQIDGPGAEDQTPPDDDTMGFYTQDDLPFYYKLAESFAIDDRYFAPVLGATFANRSYLMAATSFGHLNGAETVMLEPGPCPGGLCPVPYQPITGTIFDLLDRFKVSWLDYYSDFPETVSFVSPLALATKAASIGQFFNDAAKAGGLPQVAFVESAAGGVPGSPLPESDEHPPTDIRRGQAFVSQVVNAVRNGPNWRDSIIFITYDEHGGFYDHVPPPRSRQGHARTPDGIGPGQCADLSNPPASETLGSGVNCMFSLQDAQGLCPQATKDQPFPANCASFGQYGFRVPLTAVSPFSKPHYVSHAVGDHTSILALIEKRFFRLGPQEPDDQRTFLTRRDQHADTLEDMFDFGHSPSLNTALPPSPSPFHDCTP